MPREVAPRALLGLFALWIAVALAVAPIVDARPKDKHGGKQDDVAAETTSADDGGQGAADVAPVEEAPQKDRGKQDDPPAEEPPPADVTTMPATSDGGGGGNDRTLLSLDADGDYLPDALDNCPNVQNPDQADADGDGHGDACPVYIDSDGDTVPDKQDNCPNIATSDFSDSDGDGVGDPCDKSPDGIEPTPQPVPELDGRGGEGEAEPPAPVNGEGQDGKSIERDGRSRSKERQRTDISRPTITTGADGGEAADGQTQEEPPAEPVRDNPRRNEELIAEAAASGELYAPPEPPPVPQRAWDEDAAATDWTPVVRIDAGATDDVVAASTLDTEPNDRGGRAAPVAAGDDEVGDSRYARGWVRAKLVLQEETPDEDKGDGGDTQTGAVAPVPVENGLVITGTRSEEPADSGDAPPTAEPPKAKDSAPESSAEPPAGAARGDRQDKDRNRGQRGASKDDSRRNGSSRGAAAPEQPRANAAPQRQSDDAGRDQGKGKGKGKKNKNKDAKAGKRGGKQRDRQGKRGRGAPQGWDDDRYFDGGSALDWSGDVDVAGTDDDQLYLTQRSGSGTGKRRGFAYAIPVDEDGTYQVRLYFAEPYWGAPGGPKGEDGARVFSVDAEGDTVIADLDVYAEAGPLTALVKQVNVDVEDGELNLRFIASEGEPIVAAIEVLAPGE